MDIITGKNLPVVLIVEDNEAMRDTLEAILKKRYRVIKVPDGEKALELIKTTNINLVLLDIMLPGLNGLQILEIIKKQDEEIEVIVITAIKEINTAVRAIKLGAYDYINKDFDYDLVLNLVGRALEKQSDQKRLAYFRAELEEVFHQDFVCGTTERMKEICSLVQKVAKLPTTILLTGESGTGKELVARMLYQEYHDSNIPFVTVNLPSIPKDLIESTLFGHEKGAFTGAYKQLVGKFELADKGVLFLDEISDLSLDVQAKLLRAIQEGEIERVGGNKVIKVEIRYLAATNRDLKVAVKEGTFREDLFYRLNVIPIHLPPLRERIQDLPELVDFFLKKFNQKFGKSITGFTDTALEILRVYPWPGNIRELKNLIERLVATTDKGIISPEDIPMEYHVSGLIPHSQQTGVDLLKISCETFERNLILKMLEKMDWNRKETAKTLGIPLSTLKYKMKQLNIYEIIKNLNNIPFD